MDKSSRGAAPILIVVILGTIAAVGFLILKPLLTSTPSPPLTGESKQQGQIAKDSCVISGCNREICADEPMGSICVARPEFSCYQTATCERQADGICSWTQTEELKKCLAQFEKEIPPDIQRKTDLEILRSALELYRFDKNSYPNSLRVLLSERYLAEIPQNPVTGEPYTYEVSANKLDYTITTTLEDGTLYQVGPP